MIELLLQAERALSVGLVDQAEQLYHQAINADPRNAIAVVGLARVALERADDAGAYREARRALTIDPENVAALRLVARLEEVLAARGEALPDLSGSVADARARPATPAGDAPGASPAGPDGRGLVDRLLGRRRA
jgi:thioredoxin-like negative regulator of GroEL